jgi:hypothetical protein
MANACNPLGVTTIEDWPMHRTIVAGAPGPRCEPGTFRTAVKGPDHCPSWEVVAEMHYESRSVWRIFRYKFSLNKKFFSHREYCKPHTLKQN